MEDNIDKLEGEDDDSAASGSDEPSDDNDEESFVQVSRKMRNIDDENAEAAEMAKMEDNIDKLEGEDEDSAASGSDEPSDDNQEESFVQVSRKMRNIDDENAEAAE